MRRSSFFSQHPARGRAPASLPAEARSAKAGFSLPEMMLVLAIIMLLVTLSLPTYRSATEQAEEAAAEATLRNTHTAQVAYNALHGEYAPRFEVLRRSGRGLGLEDGAQTGSGAGGEDVMIYKGYIFRMKKTAFDQYSVIAEPILHRTRRPRFEMNNAGHIAAIYPDGLSGGTDEGGTGGADAGGGDEDEGEE
ncbi:MAG: type II secretion system protein [Terriglobia bacterium]